MKDLLEEFISQKGEPTDEELTTLASHWKDYIAETDMVRSIDCDKDFLMGMIIMGKRLLK